MKIFLTGFMGSGKTTLGRKIAARAGMKFVDMDREIESAEGMKIAEIFALHGEAYFRRLERELLLKLAGEEGDMVVSTGGGSPCEEGNMDIMNAAGLTVYLKLSPYKLVERLVYGREKRPKIKGMDDAQLLEFINETLPGREVHYARARLVVDCDGASDAYICEHINSFVEESRD